MNLYELTEVNQRGKIVGRGREKIDQNPGREKDKNQSRKG